LGKIVCFGDLHLSDNRPWSLDVAKEIVKYLCSLEHNNEDNTGVFLGDMTESVINSGEVVQQLLELLTCLRLKETYVIMGNHDLKMKKGKMTSPLSFLNEKGLVPKNIHLVRTMSTVVLEGMTVLMLPHIHNDGIHSVKDYEDITASVPVDIVMGHFADESDKAMREILVNISNINPKYRCLGHIHSAITPSYTGSLVPNSVSEKGRNRHIRIYEKDREPINEAIPVICDYYDVEYPKALPKVDAIIPIWTVYKCKDPFIARQTYGDIFIRKCVYDIGIDLTNFHEYCSLGKSTNKKTVKDLIESFLDENPEETPDEIKAKILEYCPTY